MKWSKSFRVFIYTLAAILVLLDHIVAINQAYSSGFGIGTSGSSWLFASLTLRNIESLEAEDMKKLSERLENELDLHIQSMLLAEHLNTPFIVRKSGKSLQASIMNLNLPVLEKAAAYRAQNKGPSLARGSNHYAELMKYLKSDTNSKD